MSSFKWAYLLETKLKVNVIYDSTFNFMFNKFIHFLKELIAYKIESSRTYGSHKIKSLMTYWVLFKMFRDLLDTGHESSFVT